jgi:hypothetical protein
LLNGNDRLILVLEGLLKIGFEFERMIEMKNSKKNFPEVMRILKQNKEVHFNNDSIVNVQNNFMLKELVEKEGLYSYVSTRLLIASGSVCLFQYDGVIIGKAVFLGNLEDKHMDGKGKTYKGYYKFDIESITVFDPITYAELKKSCKTLKEFGNYMQNIDICYLDEIENLIKAKNPRKAII